MRYQIYGLCLRSNVALPGLARAARGQPVDITFELCSLGLDGATPNSAGGLSMEAPPSGRAVEFRRLADAYLLRFRPELDFWVSHRGDRVVCYQRQPVALELVRLVLLGWVASLVLSLRCVGGLHASTALVGGKAVGFVGASGAGKSTLAAALGMAGHPVLGDEMLAFEARGGSIRVQRGPTEVRLAREPALRLAETFGYRDVSLRESGEKVALALGAPLAGLPPGGAPLGGLYILAAGPASGNAPVVVAPLDPKEAPGVLLEYTFALAKASAEFLAGQFALLCRLASRVPVRWLRYPRDISQLPRVVDAVLAHEAAGDPSPPSGGTGGRVGAGAGLDTGARAGYPKGNASPSPTPPRR